MNDLIDYIFNNENDRISSVELCEVLKKSGIDISYEQLLQDIGELKQCVEFTSVKNCEDWDLTINDAIVLCMRYSWEVAAFVVNDINRLDTKFRSLDKLNDLFRTMQE